MKYRKKPAVIEAFQWRGQHFDKWPLWAKQGNIGKSWIGDHLNIQTLEGCMQADVGDWIIQGIKGELYPCKPDIFEATYEAVT